MATDRNFPAYASKPATETMEAFADFLVLKVYGGTLPEGMDVEAFRKGVALGGSLRMDFQRSDEWKADERNYLANVDARRAAKAAETLRKAEAAKAKVAARIAKAEAALAALRAADDEADDEAADEADSDLERESPAA